MTEWLKSLLVLNFFTVSVLVLSGQKALGEDLPLTLQVLNYQAFNAPDLQSYMVKTKEQIRTHWHPVDNKPHVAKIFFQIFADGSLLQHSIEESSGDKAYDDEAKTVIESCAPFAQPPPGSVRLINVVATFGANPGGFTNNNAGSAATSMDTNQANSPYVNNGGTSGGTSLNNPSEAGGAGRAPLQGNASETGALEASANTAPGTRFLQGEVGAAGQYASQPLQGQAISSQQPVFQSQMAMQAPLQGGASQPVLQADASHGAMTIGVLGCEFGLLNGQIRQIMPGSDLLRYGVQPGDIIEAADGQQLRGKALQAYTRGAPGTYVQLTILHQGRVGTFPIQRKDARMFTSYNGYFKKWAAAEKFW